MKLKTIMSGVLFAFAGVFASASLVATAAPVPLEHLINDPAFEDASVSPDGKHLATVQRLEKDGNPYILVFETADLSKSPVVFASDSKVKIRSVDWIDNENIVSLMWQKWNDKRNPYSKQFA